VEKAQTSSETGIAIIPFANLGPGEENEYFSDGLTQELILGLTRVAGLRVVAWTSAAQLRGEHDFQTVGKRLNVGTVLTGTVRKEGNRLRVTAQLIDTAGSRYLWSEAYDREVCNLIGIQDEISRAIVATLRIQLEQLSPRVVGRCAYNFEAHNLYLKGRFEWNKRTPEGLLASVGLFEQAIEIEPGFALAWAGLADSCTFLAEYGVGSPEECLPRAKRAALRAVELDPSLGEAWTSLAQIRGLYQWERKEAEECYRRGMALNPGYSTVHHWFAVDQLAMQGRLDEAEAEIGIARLLDPWSTIIIEGVAFIQMVRGLHDDAIRTSREALAIDPNFYKSWTSIGRVRIQKGEYAEAIRMLEKGRSLAPGVPNILGALGQAHALAGDTQKAREILGELHAVARGRPLPLISIAIVHIGLGEKDLALDALERAYERQETSLNGLKVHPVYNGLRHMPRFQSLLRKVRLA
jgi:serine/threonine-protein kinase